MAKAASSRSNAATPNGRSTTNCRRSKSCACASAACGAWIPRTASQTALEVEVDGREYELDESGEPAAVAFQHLLARHDPDLILSDWGDATILPRLREQAARLRLALALNRDPDAEVQQSRARSFMSYGRILFKNSATTLFGRLHVDTQNSFIAEKCDLAGLWELARVTKLPVQYAARTTTGTGISYMQMELAWRDGVLIPEQKAEPEDPKSPDELLAADRGGLVFMPKTRLSHQCRRTGFRQRISQHHGAIQYFAGDGQLPVLSRCAARAGAGLPRLPRAARHHQPRGRAAHRQARRAEAAPAQMRHAEHAQRYKLQRDALKWLLVCCFGYTGYKNARFGKIEAHEAINAVARETLLVAKEIAEERGYEMLHALVDSLYVRKPGAARGDYEALDRGDCRAHAAAAGDRGHLSLRRFSAVATI